MLTSIYWVEWTGLILVGLLENEEMKMLPTFGSVSLNRSLVAPQRVSWGLDQSPAALTGSPRVQMDPEGGWATVPGAGWDRKRSKMRPQSSK